MRNTLEIDEGEVRMYTQSVNSLQLNNAWHSWRRSLYKC